MTGTITNIPLPLVNALLHSLPSRGETKNVKCHLVFHWYITWWSYYSSACILSLCLHIQLPPIHRLLGIMEQGFVKVGVIISPPVSIIFLYTEVPCHTLFGRFLISARYPSLLWLLYFGEFISQLELFARAFCLVFMWSSISRGGNLILSSSIYLWGG